MSTQIYDSRFVEIARTLTERGAIDRDLARAFGVHVQTIRDWKHAYPDFAAATKLSREQMLRATEASLFKRATGYSFESERVFCSPKDGTITRVAAIEHVPPCDRAMRFWLETRRPETWGPPAGQQPGETLEELLAEFTRSRAFLASHWTTEPTGLVQDRPDPAIAEQAPEAEQTSGSEDEEEEASADPLADPRLWSATPEPVDAPLPPAPGKSAYHSSFAARARALAAHGALDRDLARAFEVHPSTIQRWKLSHPAFAQAVTLGKDVADDAVEQALFSKANGYSYSS